MEMFQRRLKEAREKRNLTQTELGKVIGVTGNAVCYYEKGGRVPAIDQIAKMAEFLEVDLLWLLGKELTATFQRKSSKIVNLSEEDWIIIKAIHSNPDLFNYLLDDTEEKVAKLSRVIKTQD